MVDEMTIGITTIETTAIDIIITVVMIIEAITVVAIIIGALAIDIMIIEVIEVITIAQTTALFITADQTEAALVMGITTIVIKTPCVKFARRKKAAKFRGLLPVKAFGI
ncbi:MAG TPA: hypothetical protein DCY55_03610 [Gammaproteobacteria bacterium]|jgi:hypothetical protein|nr:hypothetical protein [Pseudomonadota bacterium]HAY45351.1 hypothetical protein [Gammaproteobacteria bacterium]